MAKITTITNPLTGQPAQVDQLDHTAQQIDDAIARALPGGGIDTLLAGKAPAGYGLGGAAKFITSGSLNDYKDCGWYAWDEGVSNAPFAYGSCIILNKGGSWIAHQIAIAGYGQNICIRRYLTPTDTWDAWEWVNPPMQPGVEYRTTERYLGKPVYVKVVDLGAGPSANTQKNVTHGISNMGHIVDYAVEMTVDGAQALSLPYRMDDENQGWVYVNSTRFTMIAGGSALTGYTNCYGWVKYTKTTD